MQQKLQNLEAVKKSTLSAPPLQAWSSLVKPKQAKKLF
jgi:hypothetical protein